MITQMKQGPAPAISPEELDDIPILYEDEGEEEMEESNIHVVTGQIIHVCVGAHLANLARYQVFANMNLYYLPGPPHPQTRSLPYVSPDVMVVEPLDPLEGEVRSYTIGRDGPGPLVTVETLSQRSGQQRDKEEKVIVYARLAVPEYILVDVTGAYLPERLLLKRLQSDGTYRDERDTDGGVTSNLGFRLIIEADSQVRVLDVVTGRKYVRPREAQAEADARQAMAEKIRVLQEEIEKLQRNS